MRRFGRPLESRANVSVRSSESFAPFWAPDPQQKKLIASTSSERYRMKVGKKPPFEREERETNWKGKRDLLQRRRRASYHFTKEQAIFCDLCIDLWGPQIGTIPFFTCSRFNRGVIRTICFQPQRHRNNDAITGPLHNLVNGYPNMDPNRILSESRWRKREEENQRILCAPDGWRVFGSLWNLFWHENPPLNRASHECAAIFVPPSPIRSFPRPPRRSLFIRLLIPICFDSAVVRE